jgi:hypothetical protein
MAPHRALRQGELLTIFSMLSIATALASIDLGAPLITIMAHGAWFGTPDNGLERLFQQYMPHWLTVNDRRALSGYFLGNASLYRASVLRAWLPPAACWTAFIMVLLWVMACVNTIVRAQWTEKERLTYPTIQLPLAMTAEDGGLFRSRLFWMGFAVAGGLSLVNGLHFLVPAVPELSFNGYNVGEWFPAPPWNAIGWTPIAIFRSSSASATFCPSISSLAAGFSSSSGAGSGSRQARWAIWPTIRSSLTPTSKCSGPTWRSARTRSGAREVT